MLHTVAHVDKAKLTDAEKEAGMIRGVIGSSDVLDRAGDIIKQEGWELGNYLANPVILYGHNVRQDRPPIGKAIKVWVDGIRKKRLMFDIQFDLKDPFAADIYRKVLEGFMNTVSVGFIPLEREDNIYTKNELLELSFVPVPANPEAVVTLRSLGEEPVELKDLFAMKSDEEVEEIIEEGTDEADEDTVADDATDDSHASAVKDEDESTDETETEETTEDEADTEEKDGDDTKETTEIEPEQGETEDETKDEEVEDETEEKAAIAYKDRGIMPENTEWDGPGEMAKCATVSDLKAICAWFDNTKAEDRGSYKLPHHQGDSKKAVFRGVAAAMGALMGARGGAALPEADRKAVYNHLAKHYKQFGKEAPAYKHVETQVLKEFDEEINALILDREDKYAVRLLKKLIKLTKETKAAVVKEEVKEEKATIVNNQDEVDALMAIDKALSIITNTQGKE